MATSLMVTSDDSVMNLPSAALTKRLLRSDGSLIGRPPALTWISTMSSLDEQVGGLLVVDHRVDQARDRRDRHA